MSNRMRIGFLPLAMAAGTLAFASAPDGKLAFSGAVRLSATVIAFVPPVGGGGGSIAISPGQNTGDFSIFNGGSTSGTVKDISVTSQPVGVPIDLQDWVTVPGFTFTLTLIHPGVFNSDQCFALPAAGQTCTPGSISFKSPFNFINNSSSSSSLSFSVSGTGTNTGTGETSMFEGIFSMQFPTMPYQTLLSIISSGGSVTPSFSAQLTVLGASERSIKLINYVNSLPLDSGIKTSLLAKLNAAASAISQDRPSVCGQLRAFVNEVLAQAANIPADQVQQMIAEAQQIRVILGCG